MEFRGITEAMVRETVEDPERTGTGYRRRRLAFRRYSPGVLKVVYTEDGPRTVIISTIWEEEEFMRISYDKDADAMYIKLANGEFGKNREIHEGIILDLDRGGRLLGIEILDVSTRYPLEEIAHLDIEMPLMAKEKR
jgi:uncharacterized protein YuzE